MLIYVDDVTILTIRALQKGVVQAFEDYARKLCLVVNWDKSGIYDGSPEPPPQLGDFFCLRLLYLCCNERPPTYIISD